LFITLLNFTLYTAHGTPIDWANFCREVAEDIVINNSEKIGGPGIFVEIDESKFGKSKIFLFLNFNSFYIITIIGKYNRGKKVDGVWVFGGVERDTGKCFLVVVENRTADTLLKVIRDWILPGTTIISDCWKAYDKIEYVYLTVLYFTVLYYKSF
jgi:hypothetical protein